MSLLDPISYHTLFQTQSFTSKLSSMFPLKELYDHTSSETSSPRRMNLFSTTTIFFRTLQIILTSKILHNRQIHITITSSLILYHIQLYPTSHIIVTTQISHNFPFRYHTNRHSFLRSCNIPNTYYKQNMHILSKYSTTYTIIHLCV